MNMRDEKSSKNFREKLEKYNEMLISIGGRSPAIFMGSENKKIHYLSKYNSIITYGDEKITINFKEILKQTSSLKDQIEELNDGIDFLKASDRYSIEELELEIKQIDAEKRKIYNKIKDLEKTKNLFLVIDKEEKKIHQEKGVSSMCVGSYFIDIKKGTEVFRAPLVMNMVSSIVEQNSMKLEVYNTTWNLNLIYTLNSKFPSSDLKNVLESADFSISGIVELLASFDLAPIVKNNIYHLSKTTKAIQAKEEDYCILYMDIKTLGLYDSESLAIYEETKKIVNDDIDETANVYKVLESNVVPEEEEVNLLLDELPKAKSPSFLSENKFHNITRVDYSQARIIQYAKSSDLIIQGPPGTGKTETILNILADMFLNDKKVLVVSEKKVALDVLYNRICNESAPLQKAALYLKGTDSAAKKSFIDQIKHAFDFADNAQGLHLNEVIYPLSPEELDHFMDYDKGLYNAKIFSTLKQPSGYNNFIKSLEIYEKYRDNYLFIFDKIKWIDNFEETNDKNLYDFIKENSKFFEKYEKSKLLCSFDEIMQFISNIEVIPSQKNLHEKIIELNSFNPEISEELFDKCIFYLKEKIRLESRVVSNNAKFFSTLNKQSEHNDFSETNNEKLYNFFNRNSKFFEKYEEYKLLCSFEEIIQFISNIEAIPSQGNLHEIIIELNSSDFEISQELFKKCILYLKEKIKLESRMISNNDNIKSINPSFVNIIEENREYFLELYYIKRDFTNQEINAFLKLKKHVNGELKGLDKLFSKLNKNLLLSNEDFKSILYYLHMKVEIENEVVINEKIRSEINNSVISFFEKNENDLITISDSIVSFGEIKKILNEILKINNTYNSYNIFKELYELSKHINISNADFKSLLNYIYTKAEIENEVAINEEIKDEINNSVMSFFEENENDFIAISNSIVSFSEIKKILNEILKIDNSYRSYHMFRELYKVSKYIDYPIFSEYYLYAKEKEALLELVNPSDINKIKIEPADLETYFEYYNRSIDFDKRITEVEKIKNYGSELELCYSHKTNETKKLVAEKHKFYRSKALKYSNTELYKIRNNAKTFRKSMRAVIHGSEDQFKDLFPIVLSTPLNLASLFSYDIFKHHFDYVIFDEASQILPQNAIHALSIAKNVIIVGDDKQLKPSMLFSSTNVDEDTLDELMLSDKLDSLLDISNRTFGDAKRKMLTYHYRSEHSDLINFSNSRFYDNNLVAITNVNYSDEPYEIVQVDDAVWDDQKNPKEGQALVDKLVKIKQKYPKKSIGIITVNKKQRDFIEEEIQYRIDEDRDFRNLFKDDFEIKEDDNYIFIKNIENVQGDERDIILFSLSYAQNTKGTISANYGSINSEGGENRLNVAFTRAKFKFVLVKSIFASDLKTTEKNGTIILKDFIHYVEKCVENDELSKHTILGKSGAEKIAVFDSVFEEEVYSKLNAKLDKAKYKLVSQQNSYGYNIDLAILTLEGMPVLGIECDGMTYHSTKDAKDRDYFRQKYLESRGWKIHRIWSTDWWTNSELEVDKVQDILSSDHKKSSLNDKRKIAKVSPSEDDTFDMENVSKVPLEGLNIIETYAGIGPATIALKELGIPVKFKDVIESNPTKMRLYNSLHDENNRISSLSTYDFPTDKVIDIVFAGETIKEFSTESDEEQTSALWSLAYRITKLSSEKRPKFIMFEHSGSTVNKTTFRDFESHIEFLGYVSLITSLKGSDFGGFDEQERAFSLFIKSTEKINFDFNNMKKDISKNYEDIIIPHDEVDEIFFIKNSQILIDHEFQNSILKDGIIKVNSSQLRFLTAKENFRSKGINDSYFDKIKLRKEFELGSAIDETANVDVLKSVLKELLIDNKNIKN